MNNSARKLKKQKAARIIELENISKRKLERQQKRILRRKVRATFAIMFSLAVLFTWNLYLRTEIGQIKSSISKSNQTIKELKSENDILSVKIEKAVSYSTLEKEAKKLGMRKKTKSQVHYIKTKSGKAVEIIKQ